MKRKGRKEEGRRVREEGGRGGRERKVGREKGRGKGWKEAGEQEASVGKQRDAQNEENKYCIKRKRKSLVLILHEADEMKMQ